MKPPALRGRKVQTEQRSLFEALNEEIAALNTRAGMADRVPFVCECHREDCFVTVWLTVEQYEAGQATPDKGAVAWGHDRAPTALAPG